MADTTLDSLNFNQVYFGIHSPTPQENVSVVLPANTTYLRVLVIDLSFAVRYSYRGGYLKHYWNKTMTTVLLNGWKLPINEEKLLASYPVEQSSLLFYPASWLYEFSLTVDAA